MTDPTPTSGPRLSIIGLVAICVVGVVVASIVRPDRDVLILGGLLVTMIGVAATYMKAQETHLSVNSRLDKMIRHAEDAARAEGAAEEKARG